MGEYTDAVLAFYRSYNPRFSTWAKAARIIFAMTSSSAALERVFSLVDSMFGKDSLSSLADRAAGLRHAQDLKYNKRAVG